MHPEQVRGVASEQERAPTSLVTLLFTDTVDSTRLKQQLGDLASDALFQRHHQLVRQTLSRFATGREIETAGDSFLIVFSVPSEAVRFALLLQNKLRQLRQDSGTALFDRVGVHVGEVVQRSDTGTLRPRELYGIQIDICARVMSLAHGGQVLMSRGAFDSARQVLKGEDIEGVGQLDWLNHGLYLLKGLDEPVEVCEVREAGCEAFGPPTSSDKAQRQVRADEEQVLGWRPAVGQRVPNTQWTLVQKLGEGGFGEVWLGQHAAMKERRVFKFCFRSDRVRSLKREMTLFRLIKERMGDHPHIVSLREVYFNDPPFYVEMDYVEGQDLRTWCEGQGGAETVPLTVKLEIVAQVADALQAAHDAGVVHRDVKPANILVACRDNVADPVAKLTDFGIGHVVSQEYLAGVTKAGFTMTLLGSASSSQTGTQLYMAPELLAGRPATTRSDIYSLGVVLYQLLVGDFTRPVTMEWARFVDDPLLREDLEHCFAGNAEERFIGAGQLARNLRNVDQRRADWLQRERLELRARQRHRAAVAAGLALLAVAVIATALGYGLHVARRERDISRRERDRARLEAYFADIKLADTALHEDNPGQAMKLLQRQVPQTGALDLRGLEWRVLWQRCQGEEAVLFRHDAQVSSAELSPDGRWLATESGGRFWLWNVLEPQQPCRWLAGDGPGGVAEHVVFDPRGRFLATAGKAEVRIWDPANWQRVRSLTNQYAALSISTDGAILALVGNAGIQVWDTATWQLLLKPGELTPRWNGDLRTTLSPDGALLAVSGTRNVDMDGRRRSELMVWRLADRSVWLEDTDLVQVMKLAFSDDGRWLAACTWGPPTRIHLWLVPEQKLITSWNVDVGLGMALAFAPGSGELASGGSSQVISRWRTGTTNRIGSLKGHLFEVWCLRYARDGRLVSGSKDGTVRIWEPHGVSPVRRGFAIPEGRLAVPIQPGARKIVTVQPWEWVFEEWDLATGQLLAKKALEQAQALLGDEKLSTRASRFHSCGLLDMNVFTGGGAHKITWLCVGVRGWEAFATSGDGRLHAWSAETGQLVYSQRVLAGPFLSLGLLPGGRRFWTGELSGRLTLKTLEGTEPESTLEDNRPGQPYAFACSVDGALLAFRTQSDDVVVWDCDARTRRVVIPCADSSGCYAIALSPDKRFLAIASDDRPPRIWDIATGRPVTDFLYGHLAGITKLSFSPDSRLLISYCADQTAKVWSVSTGQEVLSGIRLNELLHGHPLWQLFPDQDSILESAGSNAFRLVQLPTLAEIDARDPERRKAALEQQRRADAIQEWLVLAPFPFPREQPGSKALDEQQLPNEGQLRPHAGDEVRVGNRRLKWRRVPTVAGMLDLDGRHHEYSAGYAVCYVQSDRARQGLLMHLGSDDQAKVYLNGELLFRFDEERSFDFDQNVIDHVQLQAGVNVLVFKVVNGVEEWRGAIRFTDEAGRRVEGVTFTLKH